MNTRRTPTRGLWLAALLAVLTAACGHSEAAMQAQRSRVTALEQAAHQQHEERAVLEQRVRVLEERNRALGDALRELGGDVAQLNSERQDLSTSVEALQAERDTLRASLADARRALEALRAREAQTQERARLFRSMLERFRAMIDAGQLRVRIARNRMVIALPEAVLFDTGRAELKPTGQRVLEQVSAILRTMNRDFQVAGHTDNVPIHNARFASNWELSTGRALTVTRFLMEHGMEPARLSPAGYADTQPAAPNDTPEGRQLNRRIELVLTPALDELPDLSALEAPPATPAPAPAP